MSDIFHHIFHKSCNRIHQTRWLFLRLLANREAPFWSGAWSSYAMKIQIVFLESPAQSKTCTCTSLNLYHSAKMIRAHAFVYSVETGTASQTKSLSWEDEFVRWKQTWYWLALDHTQLCKCAPKFYILNPLKNWVFISFINYHHLSDKTKDNRIALVLVVDLSNIFHELCGLILLTVLLKVGDFKVAPSKNGNILPEDISILEKDIIMV